MFWQLLGRANPQDCGRMLEEIAAKTQSVDRQAEMSGLNVGTGVYKRRDACY